MQRWKAQTERISKIYGCAGYGRKMDSSLDVVLGMDFFTANDAWIHPKSKKILFLATDPVADKSVNLHTITEYQTLRKIEQLERISADGIVCCSNSDDNDIEFVNSRTYAQLLTLVSRGKLDWKSYTDPLLRVKATTAKAKETAAQIEKERKWLPDAAADAASEPCSCSPQIS
eukprot:COSAG02_NODE_10854_length_1845_cov_9.034937_2_plen_173_part_00